MYGAIIGDVVGSQYEFDNIKTKDFELFTDKCSYTDDTLMTVAVANALLKSRKSPEQFKQILIAEMQSTGRKYPYPVGGYGGNFAQWLKEKDPKPYGSFGNGSAMRVSPCGIIADSLEEALRLGTESAEITHNHPEGVKGAAAVAGAVFLARHKASKKEISGFITSNYYPLDKSVEKIRDTYGFDESCQGTVPQAMQCFLESVSFEDAIRNAISIGGDSDTVGAITGSVAWSYYIHSGDGIYQRSADRLVKKIRQYLPEELKKVIDDFMEACK